MSIGQMRPIILKKLREIEEKHELKIVFACECGSRAYGTNTESSDYDVRVIYIKKPTWYLSIRETFEDNLELPIDDMKLDISGLEIRKALKFLRASNSTILEWINSPIVYKTPNTDPIFVSGFKDLSTRFFRAFECSHHYYNWLVKTYKKNIGNREINLKKLICSLRIVLAVRWLQMRDEVVPVNMDILMEGALEEVSADNEHGHVEVRKSIEDIIKNRREGMKCSSSIDIELAKQFILDEIERFKKRDFVQRNREKCPVDNLDRLFQDTLSRAWEDEKR